MSHNKEYKHKAYLENKEKPKCVIIDLEGTLSDHSHRVKYWIDKDYENYNFLFQHDPVNKDFLDILNGLYHNKDETGYAVIMCTAKSKVYEEQVVNWLKKNDLMDKIYGVYFRKEHDSRPSITVKRDQLREVRQTYDVVCAYDDRQDIVDMYRRNDIKAFLVDNIQTPDKVLHRAAEAFLKKNKEYGSAYLRHGEVIAQFFPEGITLKTPNDFFKFHMFNMDIMKSNRIASNLVKKKNHSDSWLDKMTFSSMVKGAK